MRADAPELPTLRGGPYTVVFVDIGETVLHTNPPFHAFVLETAAKHGGRPPPDYAARAHTLWTQHTRASRAGGFSLTTRASHDSWHEHYVHHGELLGVTDAAAFARTLYRHFSSFEAYAPMPGAVDALRALNRMGLRVAAASNWEGWLERLLAALGLDSLFAATVVSADIGAEKPDPRFFERALAIAGVEPDRALHAGDSLEADVRGALGAGIDAVWVTDAPPACPEAPVVASIAQLPAVIRPHVAPSPWALPRAPASGRRPQARTHPGAPRPREPAPVLEAP